MAMYAKCLARMSLLATSCLLRPERRFLLTVNCLNLKIFSLIVLKIEDVPSDTSSDY